MEASKITYSTHLPLNYTASVHGVCFGSSGLLVAQIGKVSFAQRGDACDELARQHQTIRRQQQWGQEQEGNKSGVD